MTPETKLQNLLRHWDIDPTLHTSPHQGLDQPNISRWRTHHRCLAVGQPYF